MPILLAFGLILCKNGHQVVGATFSEPDLDYLCCRSAGGHPLRCPHQLLQLKWHFLHHPSAPCWHLMTVAYILSCSFPDTSSVTVPGGLRGGFGFFNFTPPHSCDPTRGVIRSGPGSEKLFVHCLSLWIRSHREAFPAAFSEAVRTALLFKLLSQVPP